MQNGDFHNVTEYKWCNKTVQNRMMEEHHLVFFRETAVYTFNFTHQPGGKIIITTGNWAGLWQPNNFGKFPLSACIQWEEEVRRVEILHIYPFLFGVYTCLKHIQNLIYAI